MDFKERKICHTSKYEVSRTNGYIELEFVTPFCYQFLIPSTIKHTVQLVMVLCLLD